MTFDRIRAIVAAQLDANPLLITMDTNFMKELNADSLDIVEIVIEVENEFGIGIPDDIVENIIKVGDIVRYVDANK